MTGAVHWRWDQGHLDYFDFHSIQAIARALADLDGVRLGPPDPLRSKLQATTGLPFAAPPSHSVWRQYARVFRLLLLAGSVNERLTCTDLCRAIARGVTEFMTADDYLAFLIPRFALPSPAFTKYQPSAETVFPFCVILKLLLTAKDSKGLPIGDIFSRGLANHCRGHEPLDHYINLLPRAFAPKPDEVRQVRESCRFLCQATFLKWKNPYLVLDCDRSPKIVEQLVELATPLISEQENDADRELIRLGTISAYAPFMPIGELGLSLDHEDRGFAEGKKSRVTHLRTERSRQLRKFYFGNRQRVSCDMCKLSAPKRYPWCDDKLMELHHLLPLSSAIRVEINATSMRDLVALCPNCHRATHRFYKDWLNEKVQDDFMCVAEAKAVYTLASRSIQL